MKIPPNILKERLVDFDGMVVVRKNIIVVNGAGVVVSVSMFAEFFYT